MDFRDFVGTAVRYDTHAEYYTHIAARAAYRADGTAYSIIQHLAKSVYIVYRFTNHKLL
jgi:hypothetical protein